MPTREELRATPELVAYQCDRQKQLSLMSMMYGWVLHTPEMGEAWEKIAPPTSRVAIERFKACWEDLNRCFAGGEPLLSFALEISLCRNIDAFEVYLSGLLRRIFIEQPTSLHSISEVKVADILGCNSMDEVIRRLADQQVHKLAYKGFAAVMDFLSKKLGLKLTLADDILEVYAEANEVRNVIVHNRRRINGIFIERTGRRDLPIGSMFPLDQSYVGKAADAQDQIVRAINSESFDHFKLAGIKVSMDESGKGEFYTRLDDVL